MKKRTTFNTTLIVTYIFYLMSIPLTRNPLLYVFVFHVTSLFIIIFCLLNLSNRRNILVIFICFLMMYFGHFLFNTSPRSTQIYANLLILLFVVLFAWSTIRLKKKTSVVICAIGISIVVSILIIEKSKKEDSRKFSSTDLLRPLGYLSHVNDEKADDKNGVVFYDRSRSDTGLNLYTSIDSKTIYLLDMFGEVIHTWSFAPGLSEFVTFYENGDLLMMTGNRQHLVRMNWESKIIWDRNVWSHHDIDISEDGDILTLSWDESVVSISNLLVPVINDAIILILSPDGMIRKRISLLDLLKAKIPFTKILRIYLFPANLEPKFPLQAIRNVFNRETIFEWDSWFDLLHTNSLRVINQDIIGLCNKGSFLISVRELDLVMIVDSEGENVLWEWGPGELQFQHNATMLSNGNILIFDNGKRRGFSRVVEVNPFSNDIVWEYVSDPATSFFSPRRGAAQRLQNGNTLITDSDNGRVFEVTRDGTVVWEFFNPGRNERHERLRIYRMIRITNTEALPVHENL